MFKYDPDAPLWQFLDRLGAALILNLLWLIGCLPLVTAGPATAALYETTRRRILAGEGTTIGAYLTAFRANFRQSFVIGLLGLPLVVICVLTWTFASDQGWLALGASLMIAGLVWTGLYGWCIPLAVRFDNSLLAHLRHGLLLALSHLGWTLALMACAPLTLVALYYFFPAVFLLPVVIMTGWSWVIDQIFRRHGFLPGVETDAADDGAATEREERAVDLASGDLEIDGMQDGGPGR